MSFVLKFLFWKMVFRWYLCKASINFLKRPSKNSGFCCW